MHVRSPDGTDIAIHTAGKGPPVLFVHGTASDFTDWVGVVRHLPDNTCHVMDRRGRGASGDGPNYSLAAEAADIAAAAKATQAQVVVAHSFGALATLEAATLDIPPVLLYEPPLPPVGDPALAKPLEAKLAKRDMAGIVTTFLIDFAGAAPGDVAMLRKTPAWQTALDAAPTIPREVRAFLSYRLRADRFRSKDLRAAILQGSDSPAFLQSAARTVADVLRAPIHVLPHQGHEALTTAPDEVARQVRAFLAYAQRSRSPRYAPL